MVLLTLVGIPPLLLGVAPALQELVDRMNALETQVQALAGENQNLQIQIGTLEADSELLQQQLDSLQAESEHELVVIDASGVRIGTGGILSGGWMEIPFDLDGLPPFVLQAAKDRFVGGSCTSSDLFGQLERSSWRGSRSRLRLGRVA